MLNPASEPIQFCTYFDHRYLARGLCLYESLRKHCPKFVLHVLTLSDECEDIMARLDLPFVESTSLTSLEQSLPELTTAKGNRSLVEYYFTLTSAFCNHLIDRSPAGTLLTYLDSDLYFFRSPEPIFEELKQASVGIIEHRFSRPNVRMIVNGRFNVGWVSFRNDRNGRDCLSDWYAKCLDWCYDRIEEHRFADQKYLDDWPNQFSGVHLIKQVGANVGPWNMDDFPWDSVDQKLIFAHFQFVRYLGCRTYQTGLDHYQVDRRLRHRIAARLYRPYLKHLYRLQVSTGKLANKRNHDLRGAAFFLESVRLRSLLRFPYDYLLQRRSFNWITV